MVYRRFVDRPLNTNQIQDYGTNSSGSYFKYANGVLEMWGMKSFEYFCRTKGGNLYYSSEVAIPFPQTSLTDVRITVSKCSDGAHVSWPSCTSDHPRSSCNVFIMSGYSMSDTRTAFIHWHAFGTWK